MQVNGVDAGYTLIHEESHVAESDRQTVLHGLWRSRCKLR